MKIHCNVSAFHITWKRFKIRKLKTMQRPVHGDFKSSDTCMKPNVNSIWANKQSIGVRDLPVIRFLIIEAELLCNFFNLTQPPKAVQKRAQTQIHKPFGCWTAKFKSNPIVWKDWASGIISKLLIAFAALVHASDFSRTNSDNSGRGVLGYKHLWWLLARKPWNGVHTAEENLWVIHIIKLQI